MPSYCTVVIISTSSLQLLREIVSISPSCRHIVLIFQLSILILSSMVILSAFWLCIFKSHPLQTIYLAAQIMLLHATEFSFLIVTDMERAGHPASMT